MKIFKREHKHSPKEGELRAYIPVPDNASFSKIRFQLHGMENFNLQERAKFLSAIWLGEEVLNSLEFKQMVSQYEYVENRGMTGEQIWSMICTGKDLYNSEDDHDIDVFVTMYHNFWTGTIGYTFPNTFKTWINRKFFQDFNEAKILGNVIHEAMHNFGFRHNEIEKRYNSVPYKVGYFARDLATRIMGGEELTPTKVG